jgi:hypothetical protein
MCDVRYGPQSQPIQTNSSVLQATDSYKARSNDFRDDREMTLLLLAEASATNLTKPLSSYTTSNAIIGR